MSAGRGYLRGLRNSLNSLSGDKRMGEARGDSLSPCPSQPAEIDESEDVSLGAGAASSAPAAATQNSLLETGQEGGGGGAVETGSPPSTKVFAGSLEVLPHNKLRVLVVEDELVVSRMLQFWFKKLQCDFDVCINAKDALRLLREKTYDLIILDHNLGLVKDTSSHILDRVDPKSVENTLFVLNSASDKEPQRENCEKHNFNFYPYDEYTDCKITYPIIEAVFKVIREKKIKQEGYTL